MAEQGRIETIIKSTVRQNKTIAQLEELSLTSLGVSWSLGWLVSTSHSVAQHRNKLETSAIWFWKEGR